jgi:hypothetical protein
VLHVLVDPRVPLVLLRVEPDGDAVRGSPPVQLVERVVVERSTLDVREQLDPHHVELVDAALVLVEELAVGIREGPDREESVGILLGERAQLVVRQPGELEGELPVHPPPRGRHREREHLPIDAERVHVVEPALLGPEERRRPTQRPDDTPLLELAEEPLREVVGERVDALGHRFERAAPPSIITASPVMNDARSDERKATRFPSLFGSPSRPRGMSSVQSSSLSS